MNETDIGNYRITVDRGSLTITHHENSDATIDLNAREVEVLVEWIAEHGGDSEDRRLAFRLPIQDSSQLKTVIHLNDSDVVVNARSISLSGIYVELPPEFAGEMQTEMQVEVSLKLDSSTVRLSAVVRRCDLRSCGLFFPSNLKSGEPVPPANYLGMVMELQRRWLADCLHLSDE